MGTIIRAIAPTIYQYRSVAAFGSPRTNMDGSYTFEQEFDTEHEAKHYLRQRAAVYADTEEELDKLLAQIELGYLELDAVVAHIIND